MQSLFAESLKISEQVEIIKSKLNSILAVCSPEQVLLVGSASRLAMTTASDVDIILIFKEKQDLNSLYKKIASARAGDSWAQDILIFTRPEFDEKSVKGGICFIAKEDGVEIYPQFNLRIPL